MHVLYGHHLLGWSMEEETYRLLRKKPPRDRERANNERQSTRPITMKGCTVYLQAYRHREKTNKDLATTSRGSVEETISSSCPFLPQLHHNCPHKSSLEEPCMGQT